MASVWHWVMALLCSVSGGHRGNYLGENLWRCTFCGWGYRR